GNVLDELTGPNGVVTSLVGEESPVAPVIGEEGVVSNLVEELVTSLEVVPKVQELLGSDGLPATVGGLAETLIGPEGLVTNVAEPLIGPEGLVTGLLNSLPS